MKVALKSRESGWQIVKFGTIAKNVSERVNPNDTDLDIYVGLEHLDPESLNIARWGVPDEVEGQKLRVRPGQIIFGKRRAYQRKVAVAHFDCICSAHAMVLEAIPEAVIPEYLPFFMQSDMFMTRAVTISEGSLSPTIKWKILANQEFPLPPRKRQEDILRLMRAGEKAINKTEELITSCLQLKRVMISRIFSYTDEKSLNLQNFRFKDVTEIASGQVDPKIEPYRSMPHIAPDNMEKVIGHLLEYKTAKEDNVTSGKYYFDQTWLLYSKIRPNLRKVCFPRFEGVCSADVYPIKGNNGLTTEYLFYLLQSEHFNQYAISVSMRSGFPKINRDDLGAYKLKIPSEEYQKKACEVLRQLDKEHDSLVNHKKKIQRSICSMISHFLKECTYEF